MTTKSIKIHSQPWPFRLVSVFLALVQTAIAVTPGQILYEKISTASSPTLKTGTVPEDWKPPISANKYMPQVSIPPPQVESLQTRFSQNPTDFEIMAVRLFADRLIPVGNSSPSENQALAKALIAFSQRQESDDASALTSYLQEYPQSVWAPSLHLALGGFYKQAGYYSRAIESWNEAWDETRESTQTPTRLIADQSLAQLAKLTAMLGLRDKLASLLMVAGNRRMEIGVNTLLTDARNALKLMEKNPQVAYCCGPAALSQVLSVMGRNPFPPQIEEAKGGERGFSLANLCALANSLDMGVQTARREAGAKIIIPSVIHWKVGHYAAIVGQNGDSYQIQDPVLGGSLRVSSRVLDAEGSGYYLIPAGLLPKGWSSVPLAQAENVWGTGTVGAKDNSRLRANDTKVGGDPCHKHGMAYYAFHAMLVNLNVNDTPVSYTPPRGPAIDFTVTYNHLESQQTFTYFPFSNLGWLWTFNWLSYVQEYSASNNVSVYLPGGGEEDYTNNPSTGTFLTQSLSRTTLVKIGSGATATYTRTFPDGSQQIYAQLDGSMSGFTMRYIFLSQIRDVQGNTVNLVYDNSTQHRLLRIVDALGQQTTLSYLSDFYGNGTNANFYKISQVTDPWGRHATFTYDNPIPVGTDTAQLATITDEGGLMSQFTYTNDGSGFMMAMATPYGTTTFATGYDPSSLTRWLTATDPLNQTERLEFNQTQVYTNVMHEVLPPDFQNSSTAYYGYRDSFFWDKNAMAQMGGVITPDSYNTKAVIYHWLHVPGASPAMASGTLESMKKPQESRVCYIYQGQTSPYIYEGTNDQPIAVERVLDDGTTQTNQYQYNNQGYVTQYIDPLGRTTTYNYAPNQIDLLRIQQGAGQILATVAYDPAHPHLPQTITDASGQVTSFAYNNFGQVQTITDAKNEQTTFAYDSNGYLQSVTNALPGSTTSFTYDSAGRVKTVADSSGYTLTYNYDVFNRLTRVTYPDGTFEETIYKYLNVQNTRDRLGRWSDYFFDPLQRVVAIRDPLGRMTQFQWCTCGALEAVIDPMNHVTTWTHDLEERVISKTYPDGSSDNYLYETNSSRLKLFTSALNNPVTYSYYADDDLKEVLRTNISANPSVQFTYDSVYNRVSTIQTVENNAASYTYNYQAVPTSIPSPTTGNGMLSSISASLSGNNYTLSYAYDALSRVIGRAIGGVNTGISYDALGRVAGITNILGSFTNNYVGVTPLLASVVYPNGQSNSFSYLAVTNDERLAEIWNQHAGTNISKFDYTYDANGQIQTWTQQADAATPQMYQYQYDRASQLISAVLKTTGASPTVLKQFAYLYDVDGNRTSEQIGGSSPSQTSLNSSSYNNLNQKTNQSPGGILQVQGALNGAASVTVNGNAAVVNNDLTFSAYSSNTVASVAGTSNNLSVVATYSIGKVTNNYGVIVTGTTNQTLTYDGAGELLNDGVRTYTWENGVMTAVTNGTHVTKFLYDGLGRRISTQEWSGGTMTNQTYQIWCGAELCEERSSSFTVNKRFFGQGEQISGTNYYFTRDHLGSIREVLNSSGVMQARYDYDPYGRQTQIAGTLVSDFGFAGMYYHAISGLNLTLFRQYDPNKGGWLSRDPLQELAGLNLYAYVFNNPTGFIDPLGLISWGKIAGYALGGIAIGAAIIAGGPAVLGLLAVSAVVGAAVGGITTGTWSGAAQGAFVGAASASVGLFLAPVALAAAGGEVSIGATLTGAGTGLFSSVDSQLVNGECITSAKNLTKDAVSAIGGGIMGKVLSPLVEAQPDLGTKALAGLASSLPRTAANEIVDVGAAELQKGQSIMNSHVNDVNNGGN